MISGIHAIIYSKQAERLREFFRDILQLPSVDAGHGWLIFAAPPAELAMHPDEDSYHELYLMCDDVQSTTEILKTKGVTLTTPISDRGWGLVTRLKLPSGDEIGLYEPRHPTAIGLRTPANRQQKTRSKQKTVRRSRTAQPVGKKNIGRKTAGSRSERSPARKTAKALSRRDRHK